MINVNNILFKINCKINIIVEPFFLDRIVEAFSIKGSERPIAGRMFYIRVVFRERGMKTNGRAKRRGTF